MTEDKQEQPVGILGTITGWMTDEKFWHDVATRTLSILISGFILFVIAVLGGSFKSP